MKINAIYILTAFAEIAGCYAFFAWLRLSKSIWLLVPGILALFVFVWLLTLHPFQQVGRVYAAYGGVYIVASLLWLWVVEGVFPTRWDFLGCFFCLLGAAIIYRNNLQV